MNQALSNKYFYIGAIVSAVLTFLLSLGMMHVLNVIEPAIEEFESAPFIAKSQQYVAEIKTVCTLRPNQEFLLVSFVGSNMEVITKVEPIILWTKEYEQQLTNTIKLAIMRGATQLSLMPLPATDKGPII